MRRNDTEKVPEAYSQSPSRASKLPSNANKDFWQKDFRKIMFYRIETSVKLIFLS